jgi:hypothetical protein
VSTTVIHDRVRRSHGAAASPQRCATEGRCKVNAVVIGRISERSRDQPQHTLLDHPVARHRDPIAGYVAELLLGARRARNGRHAPGRAQSLGHSGSRPAFGGAAPFRPAFDALGDGGSATCIWISVGDSEVTMVPVGNLAFLANDRLLDALGACLGLERSIRVDLTHTESLDVTCARTLLAACQSDARLTITRARPQARSMLGLLGRLGRSHLRSLPSRPRYERDARE